MKEKNNHPAQAKRKKVADYRSFLMNQHIVFGTFMAIIHLFALFALQPKFWNFASLITFLILYWLTLCLGITLGYHRLLAHKSFEVPIWLERFFATCGLLAIQGGPIDWCGVHRMHHSFSDLDGDPHNSKLGFWYCHFAWILDTPAAKKRHHLIPNYSADLVKNPYYRFINKKGLLFQIPIGLSLFLIGKSLNVDPWSLILWGIPLRIVAGFHATWLVNSAAHIWGSVEFNSKDFSKNNKWVALLTFGEGWHNNHHAFPSSSKHGLLKNQIDLTWQHIRFLANIGLAKKIKLPNKIIYNN